MRKLFSQLMNATLLAGLVACGGGGGSAGTTTGSSGSSSSSSSSSSTSTPTLTLALVDSAGAVLSVNAVTSGSTFYARATVVNAAGAAVPNALVTFSTDNTIGTLSSAAVLTNASGVGKVQISPANLTVTSAAQLTAQTTVSSTVLSASLNYQTSAANVTLGAVTSTPSTITALQSSAVTVAATVNGVAATAGQVAVSFSASCGSFSPTTATTSSSGSASSTYQSTATCAGAVTLNASAVAGAAASTGTVNVAAAQAANILFTSATPTSLVVASATGTKQSTVKFQVVDGTGTGMGSQAVTISLDAQSSAAGVTFNVGGTFTAANQTVNTDGSGYASVIIQSGTLPTPIIVKGAVSASMFAFSSGIVVTSGTASQNSSSLTATKTSIEGLNVDGIQTTLTMRASDRQSNPIPTGTAVTFVASHGTIQGSCLTDATSSCSVTYTSSGVVRPASGFVQILAYMNGEESFVDLNGNNVWDSGETFYDMGMVFRDDNFNGVSDVGEQTYPGGQTGSVSCASNPYAFNSVTSTCDNTWSSSIRVRQSLKLGLSAQTASIILSGTATINGFAVTIASSANAAVGMPTGSTIAAAVGTTGTTCTVSSVSPNTVRNVNFAANHAVLLNGLPSCSGVRIDVIVTSPLGIATPASFFIP